jgi:hypothetical protein
VPILYEVWLHAAKKVARKTAVKSRFFMLRFATLKRFANLIYFSRWVMIVKIRTRAESGHPGVNNNCGKPLSRVHLPSDSAVSSP